MRGASGEDPDDDPDRDDDSDPDEFEWAGRSPTDDAETDSTAQTDDDTTAADTTVTDATDADTAGAGEERAGRDDGQAGSDEEPADAVGEQPDLDGDPADASGEAEDDASEIDPTELTVSERSLHPRIRTLWIVRAVLWGIALGAIATAATWQWLEISLLFPAALGVVLVVLFVVHAILRYRAWQYEFREDAIYLERGVLTRVRTVVPFVRIQHVDTARGPIDRLAGLSTLVVYTAGSRGADVTIPGIEADRADEHQRRLKQLAIAAEDDTAV